MNWYRRLTRPKQAVPGAAAEHLSVDPAFLAWQINRGDFGRARAGSTAGGVAARRALSGAGGEGVSGAARQGEASGPPLNGYSAGQIGDRKAGIERRRR